MPERFDAQSGTGRIPAEADLSDFRVLSVGMLHMPGRPAFEKSRRAAPAAEI